jgi:hypothetical protein
MIDLPPAPPAHGAGLLVAAIVYWSVIIGLILLAICTYQYVSYEAPIPISCIAGPHQQCSVQTINGVYTTYYGYGGMIGLASPTPHYGGTP